MRRRRARAIFAAALLRADGWIAVSRTRRLSPPATAGPAAHPAPKVIASARALRPRARVKAAGVGSLCGDCARPTRTWVEQHRDGHPEVDCSIEPEESTGHTEGGVCGEWQCGQRAAAIGAIGLQAGARTHIRHESCSCIADGRSDGVDCNAGR